MIALTSLAHSCHRQGRLQEAEQLCRRALKTQIRYLDTSHEIVPVTTFALGMILEDLGKTDEAINTLIDAIQGLERAGRSQRDMLLMAYRALISACEKNGSRDSPLFSCLYSTTLYH
jgi:tetratricopeptide (TPR) repeat protein